MKRVTFMIMFSVFSLALTLAPSCKKDDKANPDKNHFVLNGETFDLAKGFIEDFGDNGNGSYDFDVYLTSSDINYSDLLQEFNGTGEFIFIDFNTSSESGLVKGTYTYSNERNAFTFVDGTVGKDYDLLTFIGEDYDVIGGTVDVEINGSEVILDFDLTISNNTSVTGRFKGPLRSVD